MTKIKNIEINEGFKDAIEIVENSCDHLLLAGRAGTGKSTFLDYFRSVTNKKIVILASTGIAAVNIGGQTVHSFFGFKPDITKEKARRSARKVCEKKKDSLYRKIDLIVIDEVSMVRADLMDCVDEFLRTVRAKHLEPFGGVQMLFIGDLYQLPPVVSGDEKKIFNERYKSPYFFDSESFSKIDLKYIELEKVYRQTDKNFISMLNAVRNNSVTLEIISAFNERCLPSFDEDEKYIYLTALNQRASEINDERLFKLNGRLYNFVGELMGSFDKKAMPTDLELKLKKGAQVMMLNNDKLGRWVNGTIGIIHSIGEDYIKVKLPDGSVEGVDQFTWEMFKYDFDSSKKSLVTQSVGSFTQYPLKLAWAVTIHKSQGKTFDRVIIDIGRGTFTAGQMYVALSRCRTLDGIVLKQPLKRNNIWVDYRVIDFVTSHQYRISEKNFPLEKKLETLKACIENKRKLEITYLKRKDEKSRRIIKPIQIGQMEYLGKPFLGLRAICDQRMEERVFRVDRILEMKCLN